MSYKLGIVILHVRDLGQARRFYADTLGLAFNRSESTEGFVIFDTAGDAQLALSTEPGDAAGPGSTEIGLEVQDVDRVYADLRSRGVTLPTAPTDFPFGRAFDALDPDGNKLNIYKLRSVN